MRHPGAGIHLKGYAIENRVVVGEDGVVDVRAGEEDVHGGLARRELISDEGTVAGAAQPFGSDAALLPHRRKVVDDVLAVDDDVEAASAASLLEEQLELVCVNTASS